jgi:hypothetical protein
MIGATRLDKREVANPSFVHLCAGAGVHDSWARLPGEGRSSAILNDILERECLQISKTPVVLAARLMAERPVPTNVKVREVLHISKTLHLPIVANRCRGMILPSAEGMRNCNKRQSSNRESCAWPITIIIWLLQTDRWIDEYHVTLIDLKIYTSSLDRFYTSESVKILLHNLHLYTYFLLACSHLQPHSSECPSPSARLCMHMCIYIPAYINLQVSCTYWHLLCLILQMN